MKPAAVYVIASQDGLVKVGISENPTRRLADLQTSAPATLSLVHVAEVANALKVERAAHALLSEVRSHREWFRTSPDEAIDAINSAIEAVRAEAPAPLDGHTVNSRHAKAALKLLSTGLASPADVAELAGVSRQVVAYWINAAGLDWRKAYRTRRAKEWRAAIKDKE